MSGTDRGGTTPAPDQWDTPDAVAAACTGCGLARPCRPLPDPFVAEVCPAADNPPRHYCKACYGNRVRDIWGRP